MAKTELTKEIEQVLNTYSPNNFAGVKIDKFRRQNTLFEVPVLSGNIKNGIVDCIKISEGYFDTENKTKQCIAALITCFEIKISKSDFQSKNGHNFVGNANYYVIPKKLYKEIEKDIPKFVGCITYSDGKLRKVKECHFLEISEHQQNELLLSAFKKYNNVDIYSTNELQKENSRLKAENKHLQNERRILNQLVEILAKNDNISDKNIEKMEEMLKTGIYSKKELRDFCKKVKVN